MEYTQLGRSGLSVSRLCLGLVVDLPIVVASRAGQRQCRFPYTDRTGELREIDDRVEQLLTEEVRELHAVEVRPGPSRERSGLASQDFEKWLARSGISYCSGRGASMAGRQRVLLAPC